MKTLELSLERDSPRFYQPMSPARDGGHRRLHWHRARARNQATLTPQISLKPKSDQPRLLFSLKQRSRKTRLADNALKCADPHGVVKRNRHGDGHLPCFLLHHAMASPGPDFSEPMTSQDLANLWSRRDPKFNQRAPRPALRTLRCGGGEPPLLALQSQKKGSALQSDLFWRLRLKTPGLQYPVPGTMQRTNLLHVQ